MSKKYDPSKISNPKLQRVVNERQRCESNPCSYQKYPVYGDQGHTYSFLSKTDSNNENNSDNINP